MQLLHFGSTKNLSSQIGITRKITASWRVRIFRQIEKCLHKLNVSFLRN